MVFVIFVVLWGAVGEYQGNPLVNSILGSEQPNLEGKEVRFGWADSLGSRYHRNHVELSTDARFPDANRWLLDPVQLIFCRLSGVQGTGTAYLFIYSDGVPDWSDGGTNPRVLGRKLKSGRLSSPAWCCLSTDCGLDSQCYHPSFPDTLSQSVIPAFTAFLRSFMNTPQLARIMVLALRGWEITRFGGI